ncbi:ICMT-domain-containing protein [Trametes sanguinea]|nr:ICMT-domain-containing protein [Trametes sanguinea]
MVDWLLILKVPSLIAAMVATYVTCTAPNPPPKREGDAKLSAWDPTATAAKLLVLVILFSASIPACEIVAILAKHSDTRVASAILSTLFPHHAATLNKLSVNPVFLVGTVLLVSGATLRKVCYNTLGRYFTYQLAILKDHRLVTWGPYSVVRHPSYTAFIIVCAGMLVTEFAPGGWLMESGVLDALWAKAVMATWVAYVTFVVIIVVKRVPIEDELMKKAFGEEWENWSRKTRYALLPYVY